MPEENGWIALHRKIIENGIMSKPPLHLKLWIWMLCQAKFSNSNGLKRGQLKTSISEMREAMSYKIGYRKITPSIMQIRSVYGALTKDKNISTMKITGGLIITILNYDKYQDKIK